MTPSKTAFDKRIERYQKAIGLRVRQLRDAQGMTLEEVEEAGYPSWRHLQKIESGQPATIKTLCRIALALKVSPEEIFAGLKF